jgi:hypothetical protein
MMSKISFMLAGAAVFVSGLALLETPAAAQNSVSEIIVFGTDPCPRSTDDQVVVCARKPESERYRIPEVLRSTGSPQARQAWANKAKVLETVGATGINSCSPVGPGGFTGCLTRVIREARTERREQAEDYNPER